MIIDFKAETPFTRYHLLTQTIIPRPIAWVLSENAHNTDESPSYNLAPFSFFNAMCSDPPLLVLSIGKKPDGDIKDTRQNLLSGRDFVIHLAGVEQAEAVNSSAAVLAYGDSEVEANDLPLANFPGCPLPRLQDCPIAYHCRLYDSHEIGPAQQSIVYAEVVQLYLSDEVVVSQDGRYVIDAKKVNPLIRLGGTAYAELGQHFTLQRPT
jgi:flavin reductase (DIM6/NTAB) family NADH-FMN oxidoreductase RutF